MPRILPFPLVLSRTWLPGSRCCCGEPDAPLRRCRCGFMSQYNKGSGDAYAAPCRDRVDLSGQQEDCCYAGHRNRWPVAAVRLLCGTFRPFAAPALLKSSTFQQGRKRPFARCLESSPHSPRHRANWALAAPNASYAYLGRASAGRSRLAMAASAHKRLPSLTTSSTRTSRSFRVVL